ncbi:hypothetical protein N7468_003551 [Penicillium chermesinum]|uniref:Uncharacterized protein n=1 Tax=Penicillium chermesinum TaxID=63820 RepID=A0A9W9P9G2_9EURO|nr:uncharacterized protein N7468_003551 [Penicillium chermesinum]KAJ5238932.1 hypothetical protein N7468_003551 [Penicillium chermesinum]KAJ6164573.1 hypothetical protein N7470_003245 [Penicillium chermesinum]
MINVPEKLSLTLVMTKIVIRSLAPAVLDSNSWLQMLTLNAPLAKRSTPSNPDKDQTGTNWKPLNGDPGSFQFFKV